MIGGWSISLQSCGFHKILEKEEWNGKKELFSLESTEPPVLFFPSSAVPEVFLRYRDSSFTRRHDSVGLFQIFGLQTPGLDVKHQLLLTVLEAGSISVTASQCLTYLSKSWMESGSKVSKISKEFLARFQTPMITEGTIRGISYRHVLLSDGLGESLDKPLNPMNCSSRAGTCY